MPSPSELRELDDPNLIKALADAQEELFNLRFQNVTGQLDNYTRLGALRRDIARIRTVIREREIDAAERQEQGDE